MAYKKGYTARMEGIGRDENPYPNDGTDEMGAKRLDWFDGWDDEKNKYWDSIKTIEY